MGEVDSTYWTGVDGKMTHIVALEESFRSIKGHIETVEMRNKYLEEENARLRDEHFKDEELQAMKKQYEQLKEELRRGFGISESEWAAIQEWKRKHEEEKHGANYAAGKMRYSGAIGGSYDYIFTPTSIGTIGEIRCSCGDKFCFQNMV